MHRYPNDTITARDIMTRDVVFLNHQLDLHECEKVLLEHGISGAPVVDDKGRLLGVLSKTDLVSHHFTSGEEEGGGEDSFVMEKAPGTSIFEPEAARARDVMSPGTCTATELSGLGELAALMVERKMHRIVIMRHGMVVGIVSTLDILRAIASRPVAAAAHLSWLSLPASPHTNAA